MKIMYRTLVIVFVMMAATAMKGDKPAYRFFDAKGKKTDYDQLLKEAQKADIVLFGELHNNPICHWLQLELTRDLFAAKGKNLVLGAEMLETDNQLILSEYVGGTIRQRNFEAEAKLWPNYKTDYKPLVEFARDSSLQFIATNVPRRYAAMVNAGGFEALNKLSDEAKTLIGPLPIAFDPNIPQYVKMAAMMGGAMPAHASDNNTVKAQALKDATMAFFILQNFEKGNVFLHFHGTFHSDRFEGIMWYLKQSDPTLKIVTIGSIEIDDPAKLPEEHTGLADFILVIPKTMTKTH
ncbi:MAG: ChaN family lipoprotein [Bacteroidales bacterium]|nr:ChaN family lipoprotein [Bacteroidales bacterium]MDZ4203961.1 ChaN family lipoprotein [Bacteroidales bacterium]